MAEVLDRQRFVGIEPAGFGLLAQCSTPYARSLNLFEYITELQNSCGYAGTTREEGLSYVRSLRKFSTFNQQINAKSAGTTSKSQF